MSSTLRRAWLLGNVAITIALLPALFSGGSGGDTAVAAGPGDVVTIARTADQLAASTTTSSTTTTTIAPTTTTVVHHAPTTVVRHATTRRVVARATTPTTAKPRPRRTTATTMAPPAHPAASGSESGKATWYDYKPGICAHKTLPFGTVVTVHAVNGKSVQCTVGDRGPYVDGYVIDLNQREFEQLAPTSAGRIDVTITW